MPTYASGNNDKRFRATLLQRWATFSVGAADHGDFQVGNIFAFFAKASATIILIFILILMLILILILM